MKALLATTAALAALSVLPASAIAADQCDQVASPGSDTAQQLLDSLRPGETGCLHGGVYASSRDNVLYPRRGGAPGAPLTLRSYPGERARLVGIIDIRHGSDYITLSGLDIEGTGEDGANTIKIYSRGVVLEESDITNAWRGRSCLILGNNEGGGQAVAPVVRGNTFHECGNPENGNQDHGVYAANVLDGEIVDNLFYDSAAYTIQLYPNAQRTRFAHNVVDGSGRSVRGGIVFGGDGRFASGDNVVEKNVIVSAATAAITSYWEGPVGTGQPRARQLRLGVARRRHLPRVGLHGRREPRRQAALRQPRRARLSARSRQPVPPHGRLRHARPAVGRATCAEVLPRPTPHHRAPATGLGASRAPRVPAARRPGRHGPRDHPASRHAGA